MIERGWIVIYWISFLGPKVETVTCGTSYNFPLLNQSIDPGGYRWPPTYSIWTCNINSFSFSVSTHLTIFSRFWVLNFQSRFEALNNDFWENGEQHGLWNDVVHSKVSVLRYIFIMSYWVCQTEIRCQSYVPGNLKHQFTQTGPTVLALHFLGLGFWMFSVLHCF